ncbi:lipid IV(A) 3-deoxy-D-manno-octulosonic acid transferase [Vibrio lamellibrachiae]|uniref:lipid IV(A) 3-deoxy-D-manno-octulosonic acid transferase n=1 Tax=Vibrio lamellibrachiae TaxID=2910253 RepID=UPI003D149AFF
MLLRWIYTLVLTLIAPLLLYGLYKKKPGKPSVGNRWKEYFGFSPTIAITEKPLWIHAASVGEVLAITPLIKSIKQTHPNLTILLSTTTSTGAEQAANLGLLVIHRYTPVDFPFVVKRFVEQFHPQMLLIVETELWPNLLAVVAKQGIPIHLINARLSAKSYNGYRRVLPLFKSMGNHLTQVLCQFEDDKKRFAKLGVDEDKLEVTGSIKFDISLEEHILKAGDALRSQITSKRPVWIAASTHSGEDEIILSAHQAILNSSPDALLILVPRHPERFQSVTELAKQQFITTTRTGRSVVSSETKVYIGDTMGEMLILMKASDACFMGGSLIGKKVGGHNLLEPAALGLPMLIGPSYYNFRDITQNLCAAEACHVVHNADDIAQRISFLFSEREQAQQLGQYAKQIVAESRGALNRTLKHLDLHREPL